MSSPWQEVWKQEWGLCRGFTSATVLSPGPGHLAQDPLGRERHGGCLAW